MGDTENKNTFKKWSSRWEYLGFGRPLCYRWWLESRHGTSQIHDAAGLRIPGQIKPEQRTVTGIFLKLQDDINVILTDFANYSFRKADEDTRNTTYQGFKSQTNSLIVALSGALSFAEPEILSIPDETLEQFYQEQSELSVYKRYIHDIRRKKAHILSNAEEKIMAAAGEMAQAPDEIYGLLNNADMTFPDITDSNGKQRQ